VRVAHTPGPSHCLVQIGLHSAQSGAAMAMFLSEVPVFQIMLFGRWASDAFLCYVRKQAKEFSAGISH